jgi:predicted enzyme related to lactoylglutathione lyase
MANPFVHVELNTPILKRRRYFIPIYFSGNCRMPNPTVPTGTYTTINVGEGTGGGIMKQIAGGPSGWLAYVEVDDVSRRNEESRVVRAEIMKDVTEVMGMGSLSFIRDPTGAVLGLGGVRVAMTKVLLGFYATRHCCPWGRRHVRDSAERVVHIFCCIP